MTQWPAAGHTVVEWTTRAGLRPHPAWLTPEEHARAARFADPLGERWAAARCWVRARLADYLHTRPDRVPLVVDDRGRPRVVGLDGDFNLSHTGHLLVLAVSGSRVGVDIEEPPGEQEDLIGLARVVGTADEVDQLAALPSALRREAFQRWWVRKEAVLKADGAGFLTDARGVHVGLTHPSPPAPWTVLDHGALGHPGHGPCLAGTVHTLLATAHEVTAGGPEVVVRAVSPRGLLG